MMRINDRQLVRDSYIGKIADRDIIVIRVEKTKKWDKKGI